MTKETTVLKIFFDKSKTFERQNIKFLKGLIGLYFIFNDKAEIQNPLKKSRRLYIGMSEKRTRQVDQAENKLDKMLI